MDGFRFIHAADLHLDTPFSGLARLDPELAALLRDASLDAFDALIDWVIEADAAALLIAGDLYDGPERGLRAQLRLRSGLQRLADEGRSCFIVHGNHDPLEEGWSAIERWPATVSIFPSAAPERRPLMRGGKRLAWVQGQSYAERAERRPLARGFASSASGEFEIGLLHCQLAGRPDHAPYAPCTQAELEAVGLDYWALGHVHRRELIEGRGCSIVYPGNLQGRSFKASETGAKGALLVEVAEGRVVETEFRALDRVRFARIELSLDDLVGMDQLADAALALADEQRVAAEGASPPSAPRPSWRGPDGGLLANPRSARGAARRPGRDSSR